MRGASIAPEASRENRRISMAADVEPSTVQHLPPRTPPRLGMRHVQRDDPLVELLVREVTERKRRFT